MPRVIWKGAVSFSLVHIPVSLYAASRSAALDFELGEPFKRSLAQRSGTAAVAKRAEPAAERTRTAATSTDTRRRRRA